MCGNNLNNYVDAGVWYLTYDAADNSIITSVNKFI